MLKHKACLGLILLAVFSVSGCSVHYMDKDNGRNHKTYYKVKAHPHTIYRHYDFDDDYFEDLDDLDDLGELDDLDIKIKPGIKIDFDD